MTSDQEWTRVVRGYLDRVTSNIVEAKEYRLAVAGVDRHGGLQWSYREDSLGLHRYVTVFVIPQPGAASWGVLELRASATDGRRYVDRRIARFPVGESSLDDTFPAEPLRAAFLEANNFRNSDLGESYPGLLSA